MTEEDKMHWDYIVKCNADVPAIQAADRELKERREDEEYIRANGYCLTRLEDGWALMYDGNNHSVASRGPTIHAAVTAARGK